MNVHFERRLSASLAYHVLSKIDLGRDAANLYAGVASSAPWVGPLRAAMHEAGPERLELQFVGLSTQTTEGLIEQTEARALDSALWAAFLEALLAEKFAYERAFEDASVEDLARIELVRAVIASPLQALRDALWAPVVAPPLTVVHVSELGFAGRGYPRRERHWVAVSLHAPLEHALCQIFHEEVHPISDRELGPQAMRDTRLGSAGAARHRDIETYAKRRGAEVIDIAAPELRSAYERWCQGPQMLR